MASTDDDFSEFAERFAQANANADFIEGKIADILRDIIRAVAAQDPTSASYRAAEKMPFLIKLIRLCPDSLSFEGLLLNAVNDIRQAADSEDADRDMIEAARSGMKFLVEHSCHDNAARGRASSRRSAFLRDMEHLGRGNGSIGLPPNARR